MAPLLAWEMEERGRHSWGCTDGNEVIRHVGPILDTYELPEHWQQAIFHTRFATHGDVSEENQHPFAFTCSTGEQILGIHNGMVSSHSQLNQKYGRNFAVDSMHIYAHIAEGQPLNEITGYGALAWYSTKPSETPKLHISKFNMYDLHIAALDSGEIVFCSLRTPIEKAVRWARTTIDKFYQLQDCHHYKVDLAATSESTEGDFPVWSLRDYGELKFGYRQYPSHVSCGTGWRPDDYTTYRKNNQNCGGCHRNNLENKSYLYCSECYKSSRNPAIRMIEARKHIYEPKPAAV